MGERRARRATPAPRPKKRARRDTRLAIRVRDRPVVTGRRGGSSTRFRSDRWKRRLAADRQQSAARHPMHSARVHAQQRDQSGHRRRPASHGRRAHLARAPLPYANARAAAQHRRPARPVRGLPHPADGERGWACSGRSVECQFCVAAPDPGGLPARKGAAVNDSRPALSEDAGLGIDGWRHDVRCRGASPGSVRRLG